MHVKMQVNGPLIPLTSGSIGNSLGSPRIQQIWETLRNKLAKMIQP